MSVTRRWLFRPIMTDIPGIGTVVRCENRIVVDEYETVFESTGSSAGFERVHASIARSTS